MTEFNGELKGFPEEIVEAMLVEQVRQGNKRDVKVFENDNETSKDDKGFQWDMAKDGSVFWTKVIRHEDFHIFFERYPKPIYPKVMMVSDTPITNVNQGKARVVFAKKCNKYITWSEATNIEAAKQSTSTSTWDYAVDITPEPVYKEVTLEEIAQAMNIPLDKLRIKK